MHPEVPTTARTPRHLARSSLDDLAPLKVLPPAQVVRSYAPRRRKPATNALAGVLVMDGHPMVEDGSASCWAGKRISCRRDMRQNWMEPFRWFREAVRAS